VRKHLVFVILLAVTILAFPVMFFISSRMNAKVRADVESDIRAHTLALNGLNVNYSVEPLIPGTPGYSANRPPNAATTAALGQLLGQSVEQIDRVREGIIAFNRNAFEPIVDGLF